MESVKPSSTKWKEQNEKRDRALVGLANLFKLSFSWTAPGLGPLAGEVDGFQGVMKGFATRTIR
jgi:hypothetical protein